MGQRTHLLLQVEGRSGARLNRVYHLQWGYRKYLPMAFLPLRHRIFYESGLILNIQHHIRLYLLNQFYWHSAASGHLWPARSRFAHLVNQFRCILNAIC